MGLYNFFIYFVLPAFALLLIFTSKYYYSKKQSQKMRFNMGEDLFFGNILAPIVGLILILSLYIEILDIQFLSEIKWELLSLLSISMLSLFVGIGLGGHIVAISIERAVPKYFHHGEFKRILYFFHWPFGHIVTYVPTSLIFYSLILLDLFKGKAITVSDYQIIILTFFGILVGIVITATIIVTHVTRVMFYTFLLLTITIFIVLSAESITLLEHGAAYFFTIIYVSCVIALGIYRNIHFISEKAHYYIQSKFKDGDFIKISTEDEA